LVKHHHTIIDIFYLVFISIVIITSQTFLSLNVYYSQQRNGCIFYAITIISYVFAHFYNLVPLIENNWVSCLQRYPPLHLWWCCGVSKKHHSMQKLLKKVSQNAFCTIFFKSCYVLRAFRIKHIPISINYHLYFF
jgi:hypothetical protein